MSGELSAALKEWAVVCAAMEDGRQIILLRKGGIHESGGEFELEHRRFLLFPTYLHQQADMLKEDQRGRVEIVGAEPDRIELRLVAEVTDIVRLRDRRQMDALDQEHIWSPALIDMRFNYRPENPLYLLLVRAYKPERPTVIDNHPRYAGCRSWVPLEKPVALGQTSPVLDDATYDARRRAILAKLKQD